jgi:glycerophosphoryl diester phosphodiesterase
MKTLGPIGILWDGLKVGNPFARRLPLSEVLSALKPGEEVMLDLKPVVDGRGSGARMAAAIMDELERAIPGARATICSRRWDYLPHYRARENTRIVYSCGTADERDRLLAGPQRIDGISIRHDFVTAENAPRLLARGGLVMSWAVNDLPTFQRLARLGVNGFISDVPATIAPALRPRG